MVNEMKGLFITFEGTDGSGKTSVIKKIIEELTKEGIKVVSTREPGGVKISEEIRDIIHDVANTEMDPVCEAMLYAASRRQHLIEKIKPMLEKGYVVICDRYIDSSLAYQGYARNIGIDIVKNINHFAIDGFYPDLTIYLDVRPEVGIKRIYEHTQTHELNRLDKESIEFHKRVYEGYKIVSDVYKERIKTVNGENDKDTVFNDAYKLIKEIL